MKIYLIFCILCTIGVQRGWGFVPMLQNPDLIEKLDQGVKECAKEFNVPVMKPMFYLVFSAFYHPRSKTDKMVCMSACITRKISENFGTTNFEGALMTIDTAYDAGLEIPKVTREEAKDKIQDCYDEAQLTEHSECEFYKCINAPDSPLLKLAAIAWKPTLLQVIQSKYH